MVSKVRLSGGERLPAAVVVVAGIGVVPMAAGVGVACDHGVIVDFHSRASHP